MTLKVGVLGALGKVGRAVCDAVEEAATDDLELVAAHRRRRRPRRPLLDAGAEAVVDFTHPDAVMDNLRVLHRPRHPRRGRHHRLRRRPAGHRSAGWLADGTGTGVLIAPNFSIGAVLMMRFAAAAAPFFESVEIVELHHPDKADAPSGTARRTAELIAAARARRRLGPGARRHLDRPRGARGADVDGHPRARLRVRGLVAHQEVVLGGVGETLTIRHDSLDRASFTPGVLPGLRADRRPPGASRSGSRSSSTSELSFVAHSCTVACSCNATMCRTRWCLPRVRAGWCCRGIARTRRLGARARKEPHARQRDSLRSPRSAVAATVLRA